MNYPKKPCATPGVCDPHPQAHIDHCIATVGHAVMHIYGSESSPPFAYTVGLTEQNLPELVVFSLTPEMSISMLNSIVYEVKHNGLKLEELAVIKGVANFPMILKDVPRANAAEYICQANHRYVPQGKLPRVMQVVLCDRYGTFPWEKGYDAAHMTSQIELWHPAYQSTNPL